MIKFFNFYYFFYIIISIALFVSIYFLLRNKTDKTKKIVIASMLFASFAVHFLKQFIPSYSVEFPASLRKSSFENICAVSVLIFPFIFLSKNKTLKDYMFYFGLISGILATVIPTEALNKAAFRLDTYRFYFCHFLIWACPLLMVLFKMHKLDYKRVWKVPLCFLAVECIILVNEIILISVGYVKSDLHDLFDPNIRNANFIFGFLDEWREAGKFITALVPDFLKTTIFGIEGAYVPILWLVIPCFVYLPPFFFLISMPWEWRHFKSDIKNLKLHFAKKH